MRNLFKLGTLFFLVIGSSIILKGQIIDNKVNIYTSFGTIENFGEKDIDENRLILPSLYNNFKNSNLVLFRGTYKYRKFLTIGGELRKIEYDNWFYSNEENLFKNSSSSLISVAPVVKFHNRFARQGIFNKFSVSASIAPSINFINTEFDGNSFIDIQSISLESESVLKSQIVSFGASVYIGCEYSITQGIGVFVEAGAHYIDVEGELYNDKQLYSLSGSVGLFFKLFKNKRYYL